MSVLSARNAKRLALLVALLYLPCLIVALLGGYPFDEDGIAVVWPMREWARTQLQAGNLPLWNPHLMGGQPAAPLLGTLFPHPASAIFTFVPTPIQALLAGAGHHLLYMAGMYFLAKTWGLSRQSSLLAAVLAGTSGAVSSHLFAGHETFHAARAYLPWELGITLLLLRSVQRGSAQWRYALLLALCFWLQWFAGYPPLTLLGLGACWLLIAAKWLGAGSRAMDARRPTARATLLAAIAPLLVLMGPGAGLVLLLKEASTLSVHGHGLSFEEATSLSASWKSFVRLAVPDLFGGNNPAQWSSIIAPHEEAAAIGLPALLLALLAPWMARLTAPDSGEKTQKLPGGIWWLWACLPLAGLLALGSNTPVYGWLWEISGPLKNLRVPARWLEVWAFLTPLLAAYSWDIWRQRSAPGRWALPLFGACTAVLLLGGVSAMLLPVSGSFWTETAQWNRQYIIPGGGPEERRKLAEALQTSAFLACLTGGLFCAFFCTALNRWRQLPQTGAPAPVLAPAPARAPGGRQSLFAMDPRRLLLLLILAEGVLGYVKNMHFAPPGQLRSRVVWPQEIRALAEPGQRWIVTGSMNILDHAAPAGVEILNGYDPLSTAALFDFARLNDPKAQWAGVFEPAVISPALAVAGVTHVLTQGKPPRTTNGISLGLVRKVGKWSLYSVGYPNPLRPWPRAYLGTAPLPVQSLAGDVYRVSGLISPTVAPVWAEADLERALPPQKPDEGNWPRPRYGENRSADAVHPEPPKGPRSTLHHYNLTVSETRLFVVQEAHHPGWKGYVDGRTVPVLKVNGMFSALVVPQGRHRVTLVFDSWTLRLGLFLTMAGIAVLAGMGTAASLRVRRSHRPNQP